MREFAHIVPELKRIAETDTNDPNAVQSEGFRMEEVLFAFSSGIDPTKFLEDPLVEKLQNLYREFETNLEFDFAEKYLPGKLPIREYPLYGRFRRLIRKEVELAGISENDRTLFIGSGPFPISAILLADSTFAQIDCLDTDPNAIEKSVQVLKILGFEDQVKVFQGDGATGNMLNYDVIIIALLAQPKERIIDNIWRHASKDSRIICRTSEGVMTLFYKGVPPEQLSASGHFRIEGKHAAGFNDTISFMLLRVGREADTR